MFRAFRFIVDLFTQRHGIIAFVFFLLVGLLMRQAPNFVKENIVSSILGTVLYPAQMAISSLDAYRSVVAENEQLLI